jgi:hypothetical protein
MEESKNPPDPFQMLYRAKWNVPRAAQEMGLPTCETSWEEVKRQFREWAISHTEEYFDEV